MTATSDRRCRILADAISGAVKSETALPPNPAGANLLANKIREKGDRG
jgi:hypothetical protein